MGEAPQLRLTASTSADELLTGVAPNYQAVRPTPPPPQGSPIIDILPAKYSLHSIAALWNAGHLSDPQLARLSKPAQEYHVRQNSLLRRCAAATLSHPRPYLSTADWTFLRQLGHDGLEDEGGLLVDSRVGRAIVASNICNGLLLIAQLYAFVCSHSLSLLAVFLDAFLDLVSGIVVGITWYLKSRKDTHRYPVGRSRLEPLGVIGMACLMTAATMVTLEQSIGGLMEGESASFGGLTVGVGSVLVGALLTKSVLYFYCSAIPNASVKALAEDHYNDCLSNAVSFCTVLLAQHLVWWLDPVGGIVISCLIIRNWLVHTLEHCDQLLGKTGGREVVGVLTFMACNHHPEIKLVDTVRAYHVGQGLYAEVDIVLAEDMPLWQAHDIGESLQVRIEGIEGVERCFVHIDTEARHSPNIEHKEI